MKNIFSFLLLITTQSAFAEPPDWFLQPAANNYEIIGYGQSESLVRAKEQALRDISQTLKVKIASSTEVRERLDNNEFGRDVEQNLKTSSSAVLMGAKVTKSQLLDDIWYVAISYDTSSLGNKFKRALKKYKLKNEQANYLSATKLINEINNEVGYKLEYSLIRENNLWKLKYDNVKFPLTEADLVKLFHSQTGNNIRLKLNKKIFYSQDTMQFSLKAKDTGYVSMLYVEANGKVGTLYANRKSRKNMRFPEKNSGVELTVSNPYKKVLHEMYLAIWSPKPINLTTFEDVQGDYLDDSNYKFADLITLLDKNDFSSVVVKIKH